MVTIFASHKGNRVASDPLHPALPALCFVARAQVDCPAACHWSHVAVGTSLALASVDAYSLAMRHIETDHPSARVGTEFHVWDSRSGQHFFGVNITPYFQRGGLIATVYFLDHGGQLISRVHGLSLLQAMWVGFFSLGARRARRLTTRLPKMFSVQLTDATVLRSFLLHGFVIQEGWAEDLIGHGNSALLADNGLDTVIDRGALVEAASDVARSWVWSGNLYARPLVLRQKSIFWRLPDVLGKKWPGNFNGLGET
jgi:hypothetical protein